MNQCEQQNSDVMMFRAKDHEARYTDTLSKMSSTDSRHTSCAYLIALVEAPVEDCFDLEKDTIKTDMLEHGWINETSRRVLTLAMNLWDHAIPADVSEVFGDTDDLLAEFMYYAIQIRFGYVPSFLCK